MKLIVGLGNPGRSYAKNRHNVGFQCLDFFAHAHRFDFNRRQAKAHLALGEVAGVKVILAKPQTFMNLAGQSVGPLLRWYRLLPSDLLVVHDDLDLPLGKIRIREKGSAGGHKGVQSIIANVGTNEFLRIRVGIDRPASEDVIDYVLKDFSREEEKLMEGARDTVANAIVSVLADGPVVAMNRFNC